MKIDYIATSIIPSESANSIHVMKMCQAFSDNGHKVTLFARKGLVLKKDIRFLYERYGVRENFNLHLNSSYQWRGVNILHSFYCTLLVYFRKNDLIYTRSLWSALTAVFLRKKTIYEMHAYANFKKPVHRVALKMILNSKNLNKLVVISLALKKDLVNDYPSILNKCLVAHDGSDVININNTNSKKQNCKTQVCYVGSLYTGKGIEIIIPLSQKMPDIDFHVVGGSKKRIFELMAKYEIPSNLRLHGFKNYPEAQAYRIHADILLAPFQDKILLSNKAESDISRWTSPLKIFEYMATGNPIICSNIEVLKEVLEDGKTALLIPPDNVNLWVEAIVRLNSEPQLAKKIGLNAQIEFMKKYTWKIRAKNILNSINE
jgi:glycosyltransferase involved in cell wall biosynthesis